MKTSTWTWAEVPYFDGHCDTLTALDGRYGKICLDIDCERYSRRGQVFAICGEYIPRPLDSLFSNCLARLRNMKNAVLCRTASEFTAAEGAGKCAAVLAIEGAEVIDCDPGKLEMAADAGVRIIAPTWNIYNGLCGNARELSSKGLTGCGREFCAEAVHQGMKLDVSHASAQASMELVKLFPGSVFASHSNSSYVYPHGRNISDELFTAIASTGGTVGINLYTKFISSEKCTLSDAVRHIRHFESLCSNSLKHISLGCDIDGCSFFPEGISTSSDVYKLAAELENTGFDKGSIIDIFHDNLFRFIFERQEL